jgi:hypothetical protein
MSDRFVATALLLLVFALSVSNCGTALAAEPVHVERATITTADGGVVLAGEGCYLEAPECISLAQRLVKAERERELLREEVLKPEATVESRGPLILTVGLALAVGVALGMALK